MSIRKIDFRSGGALIACALMTAAALPVRAEHCKSASGTECSVTCPNGTSLTLACGDDTKSCAASCTNATQKKEDFAYLLGNLAQTIYIAGEYKVNKEDIIVFLRKAQYLSRGPVSIGGYRFHIRISGVPPKWSLPSLTEEDYNRALRRIEGPFFRADDEAIRSGAFLKNLR